MHGTDRFRALDSKKRAVVIDAASNEFASFGYLAASTNRIAASAGISKGALFSYFPTKEMLFAGVVGTLFDEITAADAKHLEAPSGSTEEQLDALAMRLFALDARWPKLLVLEHELRFHGAHVPECKEHLARFRTLVDAHVEHAVAGSTGASATVARELALAVFDRLRTHFVLRAADVASEPQFRALSQPLISALARSVTR
jgi:AcrR family transcriptional regulator